MGSCCFTPKKTHFLWWYWLALASVIGIPMLLAARHVAQRRAAGEADLAAAGRSASRLFWLSACLMLVLLILLGDWLVSLLGPRLTSAYWRSNNEYKYGMTLYILALDFFLGFIVANAAVRQVRKFRNLFVQGMITVLFLALWLLVCNFSFLCIPLNVFYPVVLDSFYPLVAALMFAVCFVMAWHWRAFLERPAPPAARRALAGFVVGALLFFLAARYGNLAHFYLYQAARGHLPDLAAAAPYMMK